MLTERPDIEGIKRRNIIDMALGFTAMTRIFFRGVQVQDCPESTRGIIRCYLFDVG
jgi:hypothetical protein